MATAAVPRLVVLGRFERVLRLYWSSSCEDALRDEE
jgi:hypothetical protein